MFTHFRMTESNSDVATSGNSMAHIYMCEGAHWGFRPSVEALDVVANIKAHADPRSLALSDEVYAALGVTVN
jgi:hypothetical protein